MEVKSGVITEAGSRWIATVNCSNREFVCKVKVHPRTVHEGRDGE